MIDLRILALGAAMTVSAVHEAGACPALAGTTTYDSVSRTIGDPLGGGTWSNARNGSAWMQRVLKTPASIHGAYIGLAGSDVTTAGSAFRLRLQQPDNTWKTVIELRSAGIARAMSAPGGSITSPVTVHFPPVTAKTIRVEMEGNGWFAFAKSMLFVAGCSE